MERLYNIKQSIEPSNNDSMRYRWTKGNNWYKRAQRAGRKHPYLEDLTYIEEINNNFGNTLSLRVIANNRLLVCGQKRNGKRATNYFHKNEWTVQKINSAIPNCRFSKRGYSSVTEDKNVWLY